MALTGRPDGPPLLAPGPFAAAARAAVVRLRRLAGPRFPADLDGAALLGEHAAILGLGRRGTIAPGGSCRLLRGADGWLAVNLTRPDDRRLVPAWLAEVEAAAGVSAVDDGGGEVSAAGALDAADDDVWARVARGVPRAAVAPLVARARLLGLAAAVAAPPDASAPPLLRVTATGAPRVPPPGAVPLVVDLSALWAGPLCAHLLGLAGARVVKVESTGRPDGARRGPAAFHDLLNAGKESVALDFASAADRAILRRLVMRADVVVTSARRRALLGLGLDAAALAARVPGLTWVSITGYGHAGLGAEWVAFGDDAGVAAGLAIATGCRAAASRVRANGSSSAPAEKDLPPLFCGDALADPLTGVHAAAAAYESWRAGGGRLLDLALRDVVAHVLGDARGAGTAEVLPRQDADAWEVVAGGERETVRVPRARRPAGRARLLGADTARVLADLDLEPARSPTPAAPSARLTR